MPILNQWTKVGFKQFGGMRVRMKVEFEQSGDAQGNVTTKLDVTAIQFQRRFLMIWHNKVPFGITVAGSFSGPRSPVNSGLPGGSGYVQNGNPFTKTGVLLNEKVTHFIDVSPGHLPLYSIDNAKYSVTATHNPTWTDQVIATVQF